MFGAGVACDDAEIVFRWDVCEMVERWKVVVSGVVWGQGEGGTVGSSIVLGVGG